MPLYQRLRHCYFATEFQTIVRSNSNPRCDTQRLLHGNYHSNADTQVAQRQGAKATLKPVPSNVLSMFERAVEEQVSFLLFFDACLLSRHSFRMQKHDLDAQPLEGDYVDNTLSMHRDAENKVMELACKITPQSQRCKAIAAARAASAAAAAQAKAKADAAAKAKLMAEQAKAITKAVSDATAATSAKLKAALEEVARVKKQAAAALKAAKAEADAKTKADQANAAKAKADVANAAKARAAQSSRHDVAAAASSSASTHKKK